jgi:hypothetical protein
MAWVLAVQVAAAVALAIVFRDLPQVSATLALGLGSLALAWRAERLVVLGKSQAISAVVFGLLANVVSAALSARLLLLPRGSIFDSFHLWTFELAFLALAFFTGLALGVRSLVRAQGAWKLLGIAGSCLSTMPLWTSHVVFLWAVRTRGLVDIW